MTTRRFRAPLPYNQFSPNHDLDERRRADWWPSLVDTYQAEVRHAAEGELADLSLIHGPVRVELIFCTRFANREGRYRPVDPDNALAAFKAGLDAIVQLGIIADDSFGRIAELRVSGTNARGPWVEVAIEPIGLEDAA